MGDFTVQEVLKIQDGVALQRLVLVFNYGFGRQIIMVKTLRLLLEVVQFIIGKMLTVLVLEPLH